MVSPCLHLIWNVVVTGASCLHIPKEIIERKDKGITVVQ